MVDCFKDCIEVVNTSFTNNFNLAVPTVDLKTNVRNVNLSEWDIFLKQYFKPIASLTKYHHFKFHKDGQISAQKFSNSPEEIVHKKRVKMGQKYQK